MPRAAKRSRTTRQAPPSKFPINNLPDFLLDEVLCRLPDRNRVLQCKLVCKRWYTLLSDPNFVYRFLRIKHDHQTPLRIAYAIIPGLLLESSSKTSVLTISSQPRVDRKKTIFSFLPWFKDKNYARNVEVAGTYNDLVLCSPTRYAQREYYICNPDTKEWIRLPPTPRVKHGFVPVGFICGPYYSFKEDGTSINDSTVKLNAEYRCRIVRLLPKYSNFSVEIYSSETGEWREYQLPKFLSSQRNSSFADSTDRRCISVACNGKLYWWDPQDFIIELDPFNITCTGNIIDTCRFIDAPIAPGHIGVCQGRLRICPSWFAASDPLRIWELKENQGWDVICSGVSLSRMVHKENQVDGKPLVLDHSKPCISKVVGFHPSDGDILYLQLPGYTVICNVRENTLEIATKIPFDDKEWSCKDQSYLCVPPWWSTPVQRRLHDQHINIIVTTGKQKYAVTLSGLSTLKELKESLGEDELYFNEQLLEKDEDNMQLTLLGIGEDSEIHIVPDCSIKPRERKRNRN